MRTTSVDCIVGRCDDDEDIIFYEEILFLWNGWIRQSLAEKVGWFLKTSYVFDLARSIRIGTYVIYIPSRILMTTIHI